jgi:hypothetical protein
MSLLYQSRWVVTSFFTATASHGQGSLHVAENKNTFARFVTIDELGLLGATEI